ncbi:MAG: hypothetical protein KJP20_06120, partial [Bacteroidia bacterium]|nr:hypothetical protein [Bacteroidia bacterium]
EFGHLICQNHWKDDSFHGRQVEWNCLEKSSEYVIISIEEYKNGKLDGKQSRFDALGKNPSYSYYNNGELIKEQ